LSDIPKVIDDASELRAFMAGVADAPFLALDTETTGLDPLVDKVLLIQIGTASRQALVDAQALTPEELTVLIPDEQTLVMHNASFDLKMLAGLGLPIAKLANASVVDTMLTEQVLRNGRQSELSNGRVGLNILAERYAGMTLDKSVRGAFTAMNHISEMGEAELRYAQRDVEATWKVFATQLPMIKSSGLLRTIALEGRACWSWAEMERRGFPIDSEAWKALVTSASDTRKEKRAALDEAFSEVAPRDLFGQCSINYDSDQEVLRYLGMLGLELQSTREQKLKDTGHPAALALIAYRTYQKIVSTYGESFLEHVHAQSGRLHPRFKPIGAKTGRASSSEPNLQNIPNGSEFRGCFRPSGDRKLVTADYSGAELRILAEASADPVFIQTFCEGGDLHSIVASQMFQTSVSKSENPELRSRAKAINFGLVYGMGAAGLAAQIGSSVDDANRLLDRYFRQYPAIRGYLDNSARAAIRNGYAETLAGRKYWFIDRLRKGDDEHSLARMAKNMPIQGTNADMAKLAMARISRAFANRHLDAFLVNMVHDELVVECAGACVDEVREIVVGEMRSAGAEFVTKVPIEVEVNVGDYWSH